jgi:LysM repeat protein
MSAIRQSPLRLLAPLSLVAFFVIFLIVVVSSLGGDSTPKRQAPVKEQSRLRQKTVPRGPTLSAPHAVYVVRTGDTLSKIAAKTGVEIERLLTLNPSVDPQALVTGQRIKLRE